MVNSKLNSRVSAVRLAIEIGTGMQLQIIGVGTRFKSSLVGMGAGQYLIAKMPMIVDENFEQKCMKNIGVAVDCNYVYKGSVFGFQSNLLDIILEPAKLIVIRYPINISEHNRRNTERISCILPGKIKLGTNALNVTVLDISVTGSLVSIAVDTKEKKDLMAMFTKTGMFEFELLLPGEPKAFLIPSICKECKNSGSVEEVGLQFCNVPKDVLFRIDQFLNSTRFRR
ncbi:MAG: flagellar brake domain-containing protein [Candidatus Anammoxibacter sp.]